jgi:co-chaperonin GroES (HSP10)
VNRSGIEPLCDKVLVLVDPAENMTQGGIEIPGSIVDQHSVASTTGIIVAAGQQAFNWDSDRVHQWTGDKPGPGTRVVFEKYGGQEYSGIDGRIYRLMQDRTVGGTMGMAERSDATVMEAA